MEGEAGFNLRAKKGAVELAARRPGIDPSVTTELRVFLDGSEVQRVGLYGATTKRLRYPLLNRLHAYVEVRAVDTASGEPVRFLVSTPRNRNFYLLE